MRRSSRHFTLAALALVCVVILAACCSTNTPVLRYITISPTSQSTTVGTPATFTATAYYSDGSTAPATSLVTWSSSAPSVATVTGGVCNPLTVGTTTISAAAAGTPGATATLTVTNPATPVSLAVTPAPITVPLGGTQQFTATVTFSDDSTQDVTTSSAWSSATTSAATIGAATGLASVPTTATVGTTSVITATYSGLTASANLTVGAAAPASLQITATPNVTSLAIGNSVTLLAQEVYSDSTLHIPANVVVWTNTPTPTGATGLVTQTANNSDTSDVSGILAGNTTITAADGSLTASVTLTVVTGVAKYAYVSNNGGSLEWYTVGTTSPYLNTPQTNSSTLGPWQSVIHPSGQYLYYVDILGNLFAATVTPGTGATTLVGSSTVIGASGNFYFVAVDPYGRFVYASSDGDNQISGFAVQSDGTLTPVPDSPFVGAAFNLSSPECLIIDRTGSYLYATNNGNATVSAYSINPANGALTTLLPSSNATIPTGTAASTPELATLDPTGKYIYVANDDNTIAEFSIGSGGALTSIGNVPAISGASDTVSVVVHPSGSYLYVLDAGGATGQVFTFAIGTGGVIGSQIGSAVPAGVNPITSIVIDPTGTFVATANQGDNTVSVFPVLTSGTGTGSLGAASLISDPNLNTPTYVTLYNAP